MTGVTLVFGDGLLRLYFQCRSHLCFARIANKNKSHKCLWESSMASVLMIGAGSLAALMAADRERCAARVQESSPKNFTSRSDSAAASRSPHSQTTSVDQPLASSAVTELASRARLRAIFAVQ